MNQEQREARLTAYALNDPGLTSAERSEIESLIVTDAEARQAVHRRERAREQHVGRNAGEAAGASDELQSQRRWPPVRSPKLRAGGGEHLPC